VRVLELSLRNYRVFEEVDLEIPARVIGIFGENGAGKTTLVESVAFALYGVDAARTKKQEIRTHGVLTDCEVRVVFEHAGSQFEVRRSIKGRAHTPEAELYGGDLLLASGTTDVDAELRRLLHMDLHVFRSSVFAEQKQLDAFSDLSPARRKEMALRLLGIKPVDDARTFARREARATRDSAGQLEDAVADIAALEAELKEAKDAAADAAKGAKAAGAELKSAATKARAARKAFQEIDAARERVEKLTVRLRGKTEQREAVVERGEELAERADGIRERLAVLPALQDELERAGDVESRLRAGTRLADALEKLAAAQKRLADVPQTDADAVRDALSAAETTLAKARDASARAAAERSHAASLEEAAEDRLARAAEADPTQPCPTCGRPLGDEFADYVKHCRADVAAAKKSASAAERSVKQTGTALSRAQKAFDDATKKAQAALDAERRRAQLAENAEALRAEVEFLAEPFDGTPPDLDVLRADADRISALGKEIAEIAAERKHLTQLETDLAAAEERLRAIDAELTALTDEAEAIAFDPRAHDQRHSALDEAERTLEEATTAEREASDDAKNADKQLAVVTAALAQARQTAARVDELRSEARYVERVAMLLDGFRDHLVARVGPELSREAEVLFRELTNHAYDDLRVDDESLSIQIADGDSYFDIGRFSGSEADLANLALRVAISTHLSRMSGADVGIMVLDEVLGSLDEERKDLMVQTLGRLSARFHQLFVITHAERVKDQFPAAILVEKTGRRRSTAVLV
jgi:DNA repair protein SbcC/Rad50